MRPIHNHRMAPFLPARQCFPVRVHVFFLRSFGCTLPPQQHEANSCDTSLCELLNSYSYCWFYLLACTVFGLDMLGLWVAFNPTPWPVICCISLHLHTCMLLPRSFSCNLPFQQYEASSDGACLVSSLTVTANGSTCRPALFQVLICQSYWCFQPYTLACHMLYLSAPACMHAVSPQFWLHLAFPAVGSVLRWRPPRELLNSDHCWLCVPFLDMLGLWVP